MERHVALGTFFVLSKLFMNLKCRKNDGANAPDDLNSADTKILPFKLRLKLPILKQKYPCLHLKFGTILSGLVT